MLHFRKMAAAASLVIATASAGSVVAQSTQLRADGGSAASLTAIVPQLLSRYADQHTDYSIRVSVDQTLTRSALRLAAGAIDISTVPTAAFHAMTQGTGPYAQMSDEAIEAAGNIRALFAFLGGHIHPITRADSGIETFDDVAGRRVFVGPPAGTASAQARDLIEAITGYVAGEDYEAIQLDFSAANQAYEDGRFDLFMRTGAMGSAAIDQLGSAQPFRLLNVPAEVVESDNWDTFITVPGRAVDPIPAGTYNNQVNNDEDVLAGAYSMMLAVNVDMDEETAYALTRVMMENLEDAYGVNVAMRSLRPDTVFTSLNAPLHPGAVRYFREIGLDVPEALIAD
ncbi:TAXI family TRAP transporter solute-binding subunit [Alkalilacustris brevis]|uniref:TAXI family TRAP transporter solute-binding subunit n=1 Tax=Alkalilacustris brevis TaxID=2026338 RepID=UPI000E0D3B33|nr:TAXI family TRAP transporter solute-binding subunit [Alkalilacustris brevis]